MNLPKIITFTGVDSETDLNRCSEISSKYLDDFKIEWGVLHSTSRMNKPEEIRYPDFQTLFNITRKIHPLFLSAHLCGSITKFDDKIKWLGTYLNSSYNRVQINGKDIENPEKIAENNKNLKIIIQHRSEFPLEDEKIHRLYDCSGGEGIEISKIETQSNPNNFIGYAGGLNPSNVVEKVKEFSKVASNYWIDMESGVRTNDVFDLDECVDVIEKLKNEQ